MHPTLFLGPAAVLLLLLLVDVDAVVADLLSEKPGAVYPDPRDALMRVSLLSLYYKFTAKSVRERIVKIGHYLAKLQEKLEWHLFSGHRV